jgi:hypothetical protein
VWENVNYTPTGEPFDYQQSVSNLLYVNVRTHAYRNRWDLEFVMFMSWRGDPGDPTGNDWVTDTEGVTHALYGKKIQQGSGTNQTLWQTRGPATQNYTNTVTTNIPTTNGWRQAGLNVSMLKLAPAPVVYSATGAGAVVLGGVATGEIASDNFGGQGIGTLTATADLTVKRYLVPDPMVGTLTATALGLNLEFAADVVAVGLASGALTVPKHLHADAAMTLDAAGVLRKYEYLHGLHCGSVVKPISASALTGRHFTASVGGLEMPPEALTISRKGNATDARVLAWSDYLPVAGETLTVRQVYEVGETRFEQILFSGPVTTSRSYADRLVEVKAATVQAVRPPQSHAGRALYRSNNRTRYALDFNIWPGDTVNGLPVGEVTSYIDQTNRLTEVVHV